MNDSYWMWRGQLYVGSKNIGPTTIWSDKNTLIPDIGVNLKMTSFAEYNVLWDIIGTKAIDLSSGSVNMGGKDVSAFTLEGHDPLFERLTQELTKTSKPQILIGELYNPGIRFSVVIFPHCAEEEQIGLKTKLGQITSTMNIIFISCSNAQKQEDIYKNERSIQLSKMERAVTCFKNKESSFARTDAGKTANEHNRMKRNREQNDQEKELNVDGSCEKKADEKRPAAEVILQETQELEKRKKSPDRGRSKEKSGKAKYDKSKNGSEKDKGSSQRRDKKLSLNFRGSSKGKEDKKSCEKNKKRAEDKISCDKNEKIAEDKKSCEKNEKRAISKDKNKNDSKHILEGHTSKTKKSNSLKTIVNGEKEIDTSKHQKDKALVAESSKKRSEICPDKSKHRNKNDNDRDKVHTKEKERKDKYLKCQDKEKKSHHSGFAKDSISEDKSQRKAAGNVDKKGNKEHVPDKHMNPISAKHSENYEKKEEKGRGIKMKDKRKSAGNLKEESMSIFEIAQKHLPEKGGKTEVTQKRSISLALNKLSLPGIKDIDILKKSLSKSSSQINSPEHTLLPETIKTPDILECCLKEDSRSASLPDVLSVLEIDDECVKENEKNYTMKTLKSSIHDILKKLESPKKANTKNNSNGSEGKRKNIDGRANFPSRERKQTTKKYKKGHGSKESLSSMKSKFCMTRKSVKESKMDLSLEKQCYPEYHKSKSHAEASESNKQESERNKDIQKSKDTVKLPSAPHDDISGETGEVRKDSTRTECNTTKKLQLKRNTPKSLKTATLSSCKSFKENSYCGKVKDFKILLDDIMLRPEYVQNYSLSVGTCSFDDQYNTVLSNKECEVCISGCSCKVLSTSQSTAHILQQDDVESLSNDSKQMVRQGILQDLDQPEEQNMQVSLTSRASEKTSSGNKRGTDDLMFAFGLGELSTSNEVGCFLQEEPLDLSVQCSFVVGSNTDDLQQEYHKEEDVPNEVDTLLHNPSAEKQFMIARFLATMNPEDTSLEESCINLSEMKKEDLSFKDESSNLQDAHMYGRQFTFGDTFTEKSHVEGQDSSVPPIIQENLISSSGRFGETPEVVFSSEIGFNDSLLLDMSPNMCDLKTSANSISSSDLVVESLPDQCETILANPGESIYSHLFSENSGKVYDADTSLYDSDEDNKNKVSKDINKSDLFHQQVGSETSPSPSSKYALDNVAGRETNLVDNSSVYYNEGNDFSVKCEPHSGKVPRDEESLAPVASETQQMKNPERLPKLLYTPTASGIENICDVIRNPISVSSKSKQCFVESNDNMDESEEKCIQNLKALVIEKIQKLQSDDPKCHQSVEKPDFVSGPFQSRAESETNSSPVVASNDTHQAASCDEEMAGDFEYMPIDSSSIFTPDVNYQPNWENRPLSHFVQFEEKSGMQRFHLVNANQSDIAKLRLLSTRYKLVHTTLSGVISSHGSVYVRPEHMLDLLESGQLQTVSKCPHVKFGVCLSLMDILKGDGRPILDAKFILLIHHTSFLDVSLENLITAVVGDFKSNKDHHHQIFITSYTLKVCYLSLVSSQNGKGKEKEAYDIVLRNICTLVKCINAGAGKIVDGGHWKKLGPDSPFHEFISCLKVIHKNLNYVHRHAAVIVGKKNNDLKPSSSLYESVSADEVLSRV